MKGLKRDEKKMIFSLNIHETNLVLGITQSLNIAILFILWPPPMKLRICPWTLKNYEFATRLKISYLYFNLTK